MIQAIAPNLICIDRVPMSTLTWGIIEIEKRNHGYVVYATPAYPLRNHRDDTDRFVEAEIATFEFVGEAEDFRDQVTRAWALSRWMKPSLLVSSPEFDRPHMELLGMLAIDVEANDVTVR